jgi:hypothetical protein
MERYGSLATVLSDPEDRDAAIEISGARDSVTIASPDATRRCVQANRGRRDLDPIATLKHSGATHHGPPRRAGRADPRRSIGKDRY